MAANRRKVLVPLATLMVAGSVAVGSGASFTSTTASTTTVTSGNVTHTNDVSSLVVTNIKDDDVITGSVTIKNTGSLAADLTLAETSNGTSATDPTAKPFVTGDLTIKITQGATTLYSGTFGGLVDGTKLPVAKLQPGDSTTVTFAVTLNETTDNTNEGASAFANFQWVSTQEAGNPLSTFTGSLPVIGN